MAEVAEQQWAVDAAAMRAVIDELIADHGSIEGYVLAHGSHARRPIASLRASLLEDSALDDAI